MADPNPVNPSFDFTPEHHHAWVGIAYLHLLSEMAGLGPSRPLSALEHEIFPEDGVTTVADIHALVLDSIEKEPKIYADLVTNGLLGAKVLIGIMEGNTGQRRIQGMLDNIAAGGRDLIALEPVLAVGPSTLTVSSRGPLGAHLSGNDVEPFADVTWLTAIPAAPAAKPLAAKDVIAGVKTALDMADKPDYYPSHALVGVLNINDIKWLGELRGELKASILEEPDTIRGLIETGQLKGRDFLALGEKLMGRDFAKEVRAVKGGAALMDVAVRASSLDRSPRALTSSPTVGLAGGLV